MKFGKSESVLDGIAPKYFNADSRFGGELIMLFIIILIIFYLREILDQ